MKNEITEYILEKFKNGIVVYNNDLYARYPQYSKSIIRSYKSDAVAIYEEYIEGVNVGFYECMSIKSTLDVKKTPVKVIYALV